MSLQKTTLKLILILPTLVIVNLASFLILISILGIIDYREKQVSVDVAVNAVYDLVLSNDLRQTGYVLDRSIQGRFSKAVFTKNEKQDLIVQAAGPAWPELIISRNIKLSGSGKSLHGHIDFYYSLQPILWLGAIIQIFLFIISIPIVLVVRSQAQRNALEAARIEKELELSELAAQVAHDIRSPLSALGAVSERALDLSLETKSEIQQASNRIHEIANSLLSKYRTASPGQSIEPGTLTNENLVALLQVSISEARKRYYGETGIQFQLEVPIDEGQVEAKVDRNLFLNICSNLINNSVESLVQQKGSVIVSLCNSAERANITIRDNGRGIPAAILPQLAQKGATFGKKNGTGLGLYSAKKLIESWNGSMKIESISEHGTWIELSLPLIQTETVAENTFLEIPPESTVIVLEDDPNVSHHWKNHLNGLCKTTFFFSSPTELLKWYRETLGPAGPFLFISDFSFPLEKLNGIDVIEMLGLKNQSLLCTNHANDPLLREKCKRIGLRIAPKDIRFLAKSV